MAALSKFSLYLGHGGRKPGRLCARGVFQKFVLSEGQTFRGGLFKRLTLQKISLLKGHSYKSWFLQEIFSDILRVGFSSNQEQRRKGGYKISQAFDYFLSWPLRPFRSFSVFFVGRLRWRRKIGHKNKNKKLAELIRRTGFSGFLLQLR